METWAGRVALRGIRFRSGRSDRRVPGAEDVRFVHCGYFRGVVVCLATGLQRWKIMLCTLMLNRKRLFITCLPKKTVQMSRYTEACVRSKHRLRRCTVMTAMQPTSVSLGKLRVGTEKAAVNQGIIKSIPAKYSTEVKCTANTALRIITVKIGM